MDLTALPDDRIKALAYEAACAINGAQRDLRALEEELQRRRNDAAKDSATKTEVIG